jgi:type 1 glutamine amidotransferase
MSRRWFGGVVAAALIGCLLCPSQPPAPAQTPKRKQLLVWADTRSVSAPYGAQHKSVPHAVAVIEKLGKEKGDYDTTIRTDSQVITKRGVGTDLRSFDAIFFIGMRELDLSSQQKADLMSFIKEDGKGFVAAHTATTAFMSWPEFGEMLGGRFDGHPWGITKGPVILEDPKFPAAKHFANVVTLQEEFYQTKDFSREKIRVVLRLDASKLPKNFGVNRTDGDFPLAWAKTHGKGRVFYSALGHAVEAWDNPDLQTMWLEAIKWSMGMTDADLTPRPLVK